MDEACHLCTRFLRGQQLPSLGPIQTLDQRKAGLGQGEELTEGVRILHSCLVTAA
jgi:hypothetical protein